MSSPKQELEKLAKKNPGSNVSKGITITMMIVSLVTTLAQTLFPGLNIPTETIYALLAAFLTTGGIGFINAHSKRNAAASQTKSEALKHQAVAEHIKAAAAQPASATLVASTASGPGSVTVQTPQVSFEVSDNSADAPDDLAPELSEAQANKHLVRKNGVLTDVATGATKVYVNPPDEWVPPGPNPIQTNLKHKDGVGRVVPADQAYLWIRSRTAHSFVSALMRAGALDAGGKVIRIKQSHVHDEDNDVQTTRIWLVGSDGRRLPQGKYNVTIQADSNTGGEVRRVPEFTIL